MFSVLIEDIENLLFICDILIEANLIKLKRNKKELKTLKKVIENYEVNEDNQIVYGEIQNRLTDLEYYQDSLREEVKFLKSLLRKLNSLLESDNDSDIVTEEIGQLE